MSREMTRLIDKVSKTSRMKKVAIRDVLVSLGKVEASHIHGGRQMSTAPTATIMRLARIELQQESKALKTKKGKKNGKAN